MLLLHMQIWRYFNKICDKKPYIEEEQTTQWPKEKVQKDKQRSTQIHDRSLSCLGTVTHITGCVVKLV